MQRAVETLDALLEAEAEVYNNWLYQRPDEASVRSGGKTNIRNNACGMEAPVLVREAEPRP